MYKNFETESEISKEYIRKVTKALRQEQDKLAFCVLSGLAEGEKKDTIQLIKQMDGAFHNIDRANSILEEVRCEVPQDHSDKLLCQAMQTLKKHPMLKLLYVLKHPLLWRPIGSPFSFEMDVEQIISGGPHFQRLAQKREYVRA